MEYNKITNSLFEAINVSECNGLIINYTTHSTININGIYNYIKSNNNANNKIKFKLYLDSTIKIINDKNN